MNSDYIIHKDGRIWSNKTNRFLKPGLGTNGYLHVVLRINGMSKQFPIHRIVAKKFHYVSNSDLLQVNHIDGNKLNNNASNLEWCTGSQNMKHAIQTGLTPPPPTWKGKFGYNHNRSIEVHKFDENGVFIKSYGSQSEAARDNNCCVSAINSAIKNKNKSRYGFYYSRCFHFQINS